MRLQLVATSLREEGVVELLQRLVRKVWAYNVDRHEPAEIGDTNRSLGVAASENIRSLALREANPPFRQESLKKSVRISTADNSLLIHTAGIRLRVLKAPAAVLLAEPKWNAFDWESEVRLAAARDNHVQYVPVGVNDLFAGSLPPLGAAGFLQNVFLVWAGGSDSPLTAGWLGFPTVGDPPWLAVERLWWDQQGGSGPGEQVPRRQDPSDDSFSSRPVPQPAVALKRSREESGQ